ncbi:hypothetical protein P3875_03415 [Myroides sp. JBRI-B21084]|uniref:hypothetical protein n=1 Tax=Myroides sp. JBRI-B21084 TaxID=3119977 RepID=UPI0026E1CBBC|nr:hypothetical protein [Paenimyroides cloacae]WKW47120.1 hypothetical protein P3875_03415 [Paenimyroides cloacae]
MNNGQDKSGNAFKYSLIPLMLGVVLIFFLYRSCGNSTIDAKPVKGTTKVVETSDVAPEQPIVKQDTTSAETTPATEGATATTDTVQAAK